MRTIADAPPGALQWAPGPVVLELVAAADAPVRLRSLRPADAPAGPDRLVPLVEIDRLGAGRIGNSAGGQHRPYAASAALRYVGHAADGDRLVVRQRDEAAGLAVQTTFERFPGTSVVRTWSEVTNVGQGEPVLTFVSSLSLTGFGPLAQVAVHEVRSAWAAELRWQRLSAERAGLVDIGEDGRTEGNATSRARHAVTSAGSWSSGDFLPLGALEACDATSGQPTMAWVWQVEHNGGWHWEAGDLRGDVYLLVSGPTDGQHQWRQPLAPGATFRTVPVAVTVGAGDAQDGLRQLTRYRRLLRRPAADAERLPVIFNDYMNCLWGDPTEAKLAPLIGAAAEVGAEVFVIDAGWYADEPGWWDAVGEWLPSSTRFPAGLPATLDRIRAAGMVPGLWLEPEVVGVRSPVVDRLPPAAFFTRGGARVAENGRYHLDLRCAPVRAHLDAVVDRLVGEYGVGYLKLDYNITLLGTDALEASPGAGLLGHNRAHLAWLDGVLDRHPGLVLENCASGGMRMDYALMARLALQSTSDQTDHLRYASIAAAAPVGVAPEQGAVWAYPQPGHDPEEASFTLVNALLGRVHLSGRIDAMAPEQRDRVRAALAAYRAHRDLIAAGLPHWPLGLPGWQDAWLALGLAVADETLLGVWCRDPGGGYVALHLPWLRGDGWRVDPVFPTDLPLDVDWSAAERTLQVRLPAGPAARLLRLSRS